MDTQTIEARVNKGDTFKTSWGYDQTNYDFLTVLSVSASGKTAKCQMVRCNSVGASGTSDEVRITRETYGDVFTMQVRKGYTGGMMLRGSYPFCNGGSMDNKRMGSFSLASEDRSYYPTNPMFGH